MRQDRGGLGGATPCTPINLDQSCRVSFSTEVEVRGLGRRQIG